MSLQLVNINKQSELNKEYYKNIYSSFDFLVVLEHLDQWGNEPGLGSIDSEDKKEDNWYYRGFALLDTVHSRATTNELRQVCKRRYKQLKEEFKQRDSK